MPVMASEIRRANGWRAGVQAQPRRKATHGLPYPVGSVHVGVRNRAHMWASRVLVLNWKRLVSMPDNKGVHVLMARLIKGGLRPRLVLLR